MKLGVLFSGGKDSCFATQLASKEHEIACLISLVSDNRESFMFHVPNIHMTYLQAEAMGIPLVSVKTKGEKEDELEDLRRAIEAARDDYGIEGIVTGAVRSVYQSTRVQTICKQLGLWCFNPLWLYDDIELLEEMVNEGMDIVISGIFAYPLGEDLLGRRIDRETIALLKDVKEKHAISPAGEGGELETTVLDCKMFASRIEVEEFENNYKNYSGTFEIKKARLVKK